MPAKKTSTEGARRGRPAKVKRTGRPSTSAKVSAEMVVSVEVDCVASGTMCQSNGKFPRGGSVSCVAMSATAACFSVIKGRAPFTTAEIDNILSAGYLLFQEIFPVEDPRTIEPSELPTCVKINNCVANMSEDWQFNGLYPTTSTYDDRVNELKANLNELFNSENFNEQTDSGLFTAMAYTFSFWKCGNQYYLFNSHSVDEHGITTGSGLARLFLCDNLETLVKLLCIRHNNDFNEQYAVHKLRVTNFSEEHNAGESSHELPTNPNPIKVVNLRKRGMKPLCNDPRDNAAKKYKKNNPDVNKKAVARYIEQKPQVHRAAVDRYTKVNPEVNRAAVKKYTQEHPEINRAAVDRYSQSHPEVHRAAMQRYMESNPEVTQTSRATFNSRNRNVEPALRSMSTLIGARKDDDLNPVQLFSLKKSSLLAADVIKCQFCNAPLFNEEKTRLKWCCGAGANNVQNFPPLTEDFYTHPNFVKHPRAFNNLFAFSALGVTHGFQHQDTGIYFLKIQGRVYHRVFDLSYKDSTNPIGMYIDDSEERARLAADLKLDRDVCRLITHFMHEVNPYIDCFKRLNRETSDDAHLIFESTSRRTHGNILGDTPLGREVAAIISTEREGFIPRHIAIWKIGGEKPHTIDVFHILYEPFQYPLLYPHGNPGWEIGKVDNKGAKLSQLKYTRCLLLSEPRFSQLGRLSEEWLVDMYCRIEEERLRFVSRTQNRNSDSVLRSAPLPEVENSLAARTVANDETVQGEGGVIPGKIYLPCSFTGSPRYMKVKYMDAIAVVNRLGTPSFFLTVTCNPKWVEIKESLPRGQHASPLVCARVFNLKLAQLLRDLRSGAWFGKCMYIMHVIEFQKRGLPHAHICFRVEGGGPVQNIDIDKFVRADIPSPEEAGGRLRKSVLEHMIHGPCGPSHGRTDLPCWDREKQKCSKFFPKRETDTTHSDSKGFIHLRRDGNNTGTIKYRNRDVTVSDLWVVPYNAALLLKYDCHLNLEVSSARKIVKYLFKYMTKGPDEARVAIVPEELKNNEVEQYVTKRYIGSCDAAWRVLEFDLTAREPNVKQLAVHLEGHQTVIFKPGTETQTVENASSDLLTYFNRPLGEEFENLTYLDFYERYLVHTRRPKTKTVQIHQMGNRFVTKRQRGEMVTRLFWVAPNRGEQFYLRLLLASYPCRNYRDLLILGGPNCNTFQEAAKAVGMADDEIEYETALLEAAGFLTGPRLRRFLVLLAVNGAPVALLWEKFKNQLCEDFLERLPDNHERAYELSLIHIDRLLRKHGTFLVEQGLPDVADGTTELDRERVEFSEVRLNDFVELWTPRLSSDQRAVFDYVDNLITDDRFRVENTTSIFVDGPAGTGKTLLLNVIAAHVRSSRNGVVLCTASSGIAAQNYEGGTTAHSMFRFPLNIVDDLGHWNVTNGSQRGQLIYHASVIIYDEAPMAHKYLIHLLDRSLRDLMRTDEIFGGKVIIFAGDFRQIPPVVVNAWTDADIVNGSVKSSPLWQKLKSFALSTSQRSKEDEEFAQFLLKVGSNEIPPQVVQIGPRAQNLIDLSMISYVTELDDLISFVFPHCEVGQPDVCAQRAILSTHNRSVREINDKILENVPGDVLHFYSADAVISEDNDLDDFFLGPDMLHNVQQPGVPDHDLRLKIGCVCMVIRNLSFSDRLVNGTKVIVVATTPRLITVRKPGDLEHFYIPRILFKTPLEPRSPIEMSRRQFPLQVCYAMTVHKSQGQTISRVGIDLRSDVFSHGQLYVALGRVRRREDVKILVQNERLTSGIPLINNVVINALL